MNYNLFIYIYKEFYNEIKLFHLMKLIRKIYYKLRN